MRMQNIPRPLHYVYEANKSHFPGYSCFGCLMLGRILKQWVLLVVPAFFDTWGAFLPKPWYLGNIFDLISMQTQQNNMCHSVKNTFFTQIVFETTPFLPPTKSLLAFHFMTSLIQTQKLGISTCSHWHGQVGIFIGHLRRPSKTAWKNQFLKMRNGMKWWNLLGTNIAPFKGIFEDGFSFFQGGICYFPGG